MARLIFMSWLGKTRIVMLILCMLLVVANSTRARAVQPDNGKYATAQEAYRAGLGFLAAGDLSKSQLVLEEALQRAPDNKFRLQVYRALGPAYRALPEIDRMVVSQEFIITHSDSPAERSLTRSNLLSFVYQRGKVNVLMTQFEDRSEERRVGKECRL